MRKLFCDSIRLLLEQGEKCSTDQHGFIQGIHVTWLDNLRIEYDAHCRKHGIRPKPAAKRKSVDGKGTEPVRVA
jgi:hypothetical protein